MIIENLGVLTLNPMVAIHIAAIAQTVFVAVYAVVPGKNKRREFTKRGRTILAFFRYLGLGAISVFGVLFLDVGIGWFFSGWSLADWPFQLPSVILLLFLGVQYVAAVILVDGTVFDVAMNAIAALVIMLFIHVYVSGIVLMGIPLEEHFFDVLAWLVAGQAVVAVIKTFMYSKGLLGDEKNRDTPTRLSWSFDEPLRKVFTPKVNVVVWALTISESMLVFFGYSLFTFWVFW